MEGKEDIAVVSGSSKAGLLLLPLSLIWRVPEAQLPSWALCRKRLHALRKCGLPVPTLVLTPVWPQAAPPPLWAAIPAGEVTSSLGPFTDLSF